MIGVLAASGRNRARGNLAGAVPYTVTVVGAEITFTITTSNTYAGVEWGLSGYQWSAFDAESGASHTFVIGAMDGVETGQTYSWRFYETTNPLDAPASRVSSYSGTVST